MQPWIIGNWKMHKTTAEAVQFVSQLAITEAVKTAIAASYTLIASLIEQDVAPCEIGAQNLSEYSMGAYTGEISCTMLKDIRAQFTLVGHSERRHIFKESDETVEAKFERCIAENFPVVLCVGETKEQKEQGHTQSVIEKQLGVFTALTDHQLPLVKIAYEPVWAIGTGQSAHVTDIAERHDHIREQLLQYFSPDVAKDVPVLYGGSVSPENIESICEIPNVNGTLVGNASLDVEKFNTLIAKVVV